MKTAKEKKAKAKAKAKTMAAPNARKVKMAEPMKPPQAENKSTLTLSVEQQNERSARKLADIAKLKEALRTERNLNRCQDEALRRVENGENILLIGAAGTGKSHVTRLMREMRILDGREVAAAAPFGVAAVNIDGFTLHSTFGIDVQDATLLNKFVPGSESFNQIRERITRTSYKKRKALWETIDTLFIDEISTCDAEIFSLLDYIAKVVKQNDLPFGGIQVVAVGDFLQLPPISGDWAFNSPEFREIFSPGGSNIVQLLDVVRQSKDVEYLEVLNLIRTLHPDDHLGQEFARTLLQNVCRSPESTSELPKNCVRVVPLRKMAERYNQKMMTTLDDAKASHYIAYDSQVMVDQSLRDVHKVNDMGKGRSKAELDTLLSGLLNSHCRVEQHIELRTGARVMQLSNTDARSVGGKNRTSHEKVVNGHTGTVLGFKPPKHITEEYEQWALLRKKDGMPTDLPLVKWDHNGKSTVVYPTLLTVGDFWTTDCHIKRRLQLPLGPAWAITAHKCQGMTLTGNVSVSLKGAFAPGQGYVALSRSESGAKTYVDGVSSSMRGLTASQEALAYLDVSAGAA